MAENTRIQHQQDGDIDPMRERMTEKNRFKRKDRKRKVAEPAGDDLQTVSSTAPVSTASTSMDNGIATKRQRCHAKTKLNGGADDNSPTADQAVEITETKQMAETTRIKHKQNDDTDPMTDKMAERSRIKHKPDDYDTDLMTEQMAESTRIQHIKQDNDDTVSTKSSRTVESHMGTPTLVIEDYVHVPAHSVATKILTLNTRHGRTHKRSQHVKSDTVSKPVFMDNIGETMRKRKPADYDVARNGQMTDDTDMDTPRKHGIVDNSGAIFQ